MICRNGRCPNKARGRGLCDKHRYSLTPAGLVDAKPVRERLELLHSRGHSWRELAEMLGMSREGLTLTNKNVQALTAAKVMSIPIPDRMVGTKALVDPIGSRRRIGALAAIGYSQKAVAEFAGLRAPNLGRVLTAPQIAASTAVAIDRAFREMQMSPGHSNRARAWAKRRGYPPPFAWDEDDIDNPKARARVAIARRDWIEEFTEMREMGKSMDDIAKYWGISRKGVEKRLARAAA